MPKRKKFNFFFFDVRAYFICAALFRVCMHPFISGNKYSGGRRRNYPKNVNFAGDGSVTAPVSRDAPQQAVSHCAESDVG